MTNQIAYYVPCVKIRNNFKTRFNGELKKDTVYPIAKAERHDFDPLKSVFIKKHESMGVHIIPVLLENVHLFVKIVVPKFKVGDIVKIKGEERNCKQFRIWEHCELNGSVWYRDGWAVGTNCESGVSEENLELVGDNEEILWEVAYNDDIMKEKQPNIYNYIMKNVKR